MEFGPGSVFGGLWKGLASAVFWTSYNHSWITGDHETRQSCRQLGVFQSRFLRVSIIVGLCDVAPTTPFFNVCDTLPFGHLGGNKPVS